MNKNKELVKNTIIILLGKVCTQFLAFLLLPFYTRFLTTSEYGLFDLITTYVILLTPIISLQLESSLFRFLLDARKNEKEKSKIITNTLISVLASILIILAIFFVITIFVDIKYKIYLVLIIIVTIFSNILLQIARGLGETVLYALASVVVGMTNIIFSLVFLILFKLGIEGLFLSTVISNLFACLFLIFKLKIKKYIKLSEYNKQHIKKMLDYSIPLIFNGIMWWFINASDRTLITIFLGTGLNGIYAVSNKFSTIFVSLYNVFNLSWQESASLYINDKKSKQFYSDTFNKMLKIFTSIALLIIVFLPFAFNIIVGSDYSESYNYIPILMLSSILNIIVAFLGAIYIALKQTKKVANTSVIAAVINLVVNILFIKFIGVYAAALSTLIAFMIMAIYRYFEIQKFVSIKIERQLLFELSLLLIISITIYYLNISLLNIINLLLIILVCVMLNFDEIKYIIKKVLRK